MKKIILLTLMGILMIKIVSAQTIKQEFNFAPPTWTKCDDRYVEAKIKECMNSGKEGDPMLPVYSAEVMLPEGTQVSEISIISIEYYDPESGINIVPASGVFPFSRPAPKGYKPVPNQKIYSDSVAFPKAVVSNITTQYMCGYSIAVFAIHPLVYYPEKQMIKASKRIEVEIKTEPVKKNVAKPLVDNALTNKRLMAMIDNCVLMDSYSTTNKRSEEKVDLLIITGEQFIDGFQDYINYKTKKGFVTGILSTEEIFTGYGGIDKQEKIRNCVRDYYENHGLTYVILGGDADPNTSDCIIPHRGLYGYASPTYEYDIPADMYYACLDGTWNDDGDGIWGEPGEEDLYAEIYIGRLCFDSSQELANILNKLQLYQEYPVVDDIQKAVMLGEKADSQTWTGDHKDEIVNGCSNYGFTTAGISGNFEVHRLYDLPDGTTWSITDVFDEFNNLGCNLLNHIGHSDVTYNMKINTSDLYNFQNNGINHGYVIGYSQGCYNGAFDNRDPDGNYTTDCFSECITSVETAEVAAIGNSRYGLYRQGTSNGPSQYFDRQFFDAVFGEELSRIGIANADSKEDNIAYILSDDDMRWCAYELNLFGDPSMDIWTSVPIAITIVRPQYITTELSSIDIHTDAPFCRVGLIQNNVLIGNGLADEYGDVTVPLFNTQTSTDSVTLSISAHNRIHYYDKIAVYSERPYIEYDSVLVTDQNGNNNGLPEYGETISLGLGLVNSGETEANNVMVSLATNDPFITSISSAVNFGSFESSEKVFIEDAFEVQIAEDIPDQHNVRFYVKAVDEFEWNSRFDIIINAPELILQTVSIDDGPSGNGELDPGETVDIEIMVQNQGHSYSPDVLGEISSLNSHFIFIDHNTLIDGLDQDETETVFFRGMVVPGTGFGNPAEFSLNITSGEYKVTETYFLDISIENFETSDFLSHDWDFEGNEDWTISQGAYEGNWCSVSGDIADSQASSMMLTLDVRENDSISFYYKISSETNCDFLKFYVDNNLIDKWSGLKDWTRVTCYVPSGLHTCTWTYTKDFSGSLGADCAQIDYIHLPAVHDETVLTYAGDDANICDGLVFTPDAVAINYVSLLWQTSGSGTFDDASLLDPVYTPGEQDYETGSVILTLTASNTNESSSDNLLLSFVPLPEQPSAPEGETELCDGTQPTIYTVSTVSGATTYFWQLNPENAGSFEGTGEQAVVTWAPSFTGIATISVQGTNACGSGPWSDPITITINALPAEAGTINGKSTSCSGLQEIYSLPAIAEAKAYQWLVEPENSGTFLINSNELTITWNNEFTGEVVLKVCGANDCGAGQWSDKYTVFVQDCTGVSELPGDVVSLHPNPNDGIFTLQIIADDILNISLINAAGETVYRKTGVKMKGLTNHKINTNNLPEGVYYIHIEGEKTNKTEKIIIIK